MTTDLLLGLLGLECLAVAGWGLLRRERLLSFPFLGSLVFLSFVFVQLCGLRAEPQLPYFAVERVAIMAVLCLSMCCLGHWCGVRTRGRHIRIVTENGLLSERRLYVGAAALTTVGAGVWFYLIFGPEHWTTNGRAWRGTPVALVFFADCLRYGFALSLLLLFGKRFKTRPVWLLAAGGAVFLCLVIWSGRRGVAARTVLLLFTLLWFSIGWLPSRKLMLGLAVVACLAIYNIGAYRHRIMGRDNAEWAELGTIDYLGNVQGAASNGGYELSNAAFIMAAVDSRAAFDLGRFHWNVLVDHYVPRQLVGEEVKQRLHLGGADGIRLARTVYGWHFHSGSTFTGLANAFASFWYFGCLEFFAIAFVLGRLWSWAKRGSEIAALLYSLLLINALLCITHHTGWFWAPMVHMGLFFVPFLVWARAGGSKRRAGSVCGWPHGVVAKSQPAAR